MLARPGFQRLLDTVRGRGPVPFDAVLMDVDSRLDRGGKLAQVAEVFQTRGVRLISVDSGRDLTSEDERLLVHVKSGLNEYYLHELARRTRNGVASKVLHGFHAGAKVYGYRLVAIWPEGLPPERRDRESRIGTRVEINPVEAEIVLRVFEESARGMGRRAIAHTLNREGVRSSRGLPSWDPSALRVVLLNRKYIGDWSWNRIKWQKVPEAILTETERERARRTSPAPPDRATGRGPRPVRSALTARMRTQRAAPRRRRAMRV